MAGQVGPPATEAERGEWRDRLGGCWQWGQGVPLLEACWARHGAGLVGLHARLGFRADALEALTLGMFPCVYVLEWGKQAGLGL